jgi:hypothetical protein
MIDDYIIEFIHKEIDGSITQEEKERLRSYVAENPEAQKMVQEQIRTAKILNKIPVIEPPPSLKKRIMNSIDVNRYAVGESRTALKFLFSSRLSRINPKVAYSFVLGLVMGVLLVLVLDTTQEYRRDPGDFIGTIGMHDKECFERLDHNPIDLPDLRGDLTLKRFNNIIAYEVNLSSMNEIELVLKFDPGFIRFHGFQPYTGTKIIVESGVNYIKTLNSEDIRYVLFFQRESHESTRFELTLLRSGIVQYERKIDLTATHGENDKRR